MVPPSRVALVIILSMQIILHCLNWCFTSCWCQKSKYFLFFSLFPFPLPFSFEGAWRAVAHGACGVLNFVLNRPFIAAKFSLRAPNKLPHYPSQSITLLRTNYHSEYHTTFTKCYPMYLHQSIARAPPTPLTVLEGRVTAEAEAVVVGKIEKVEILQEEEKQLLDYVLLHTASSSSSSSCSF